MNRPVKTVLVVEDDPILRRALLSGLGSHGYRVFATGSPDIAYGMLADEEIDAILLDVRLPTMSGLAFHLAAVHRWPHLSDRIALMTGNPEADDVRAWQRKNGGALFAKPFSSETVTRWLSGLLLVEPTGENQG